MIIVLPKSLPDLRPELNIKQSPSDFSGTPNWVVYDPHNNRYYSIGWIEHEILKHWHLKTPTLIIEAVNKESPVKIGEKDIHDLLEFLSKSCLLRQSHKAIGKIAALQKERSKKNIFEQFAQYYLFIRIAIVHPDKFLDRTIKYVKWVFSKTTFFVMMLMLIAGIFLVSRQWGKFATSVLYIFSPKEFMIFVFTVAFAKFAHEFAHAYRCKSFGLNVPAMGLGMTTFVPLMYTDASASWQLDNPLQRFLISIAGVQIEFYLAIVALFLWPFLPDGVLKSMAFFLATINLSVTILVNMSPFVRFDGYYILSDLLNARNLQQRSFSITKWRIRKLILGLKLPPPEELSATKQFRTYAKNIFLKLFSDNFHFSA